jgi:small multidrug resistance pump
MNRWMLLAAAILFEVAGTTSMKLSNGFRALVPSGLVVVCYAVSLVALTLALREIEIGVAYAIWAGAGTAGIAIIGSVLFREPGGPLKWASLVAIVLGIAGIHLSRAPQ